MGLIRFLVPRPDFLPAEGPERAYFAGFDEIPWRGRVVRTGTEVILDRAESDSGNFHILWRVAGRCPLALTTGTLMERPTPYHLPVELARGTINRLRGQIAIWEGAGLVIPADVPVGLHEAQSHFARAATTQDKPEMAADHAQRAIEMALATGEKLVHAFAEQTGKIREAQVPKLTLLFGGNLDNLPANELLGSQFPSAFNTAMVPFSWNKIQGREGKRDWGLFDGQIAWCQANSMRILGGPLLELDKAALPDWLYLWEGDFDNLIAMLSEHVNATVTRYRGRVQLWNCASRVNTIDTLSLSEEQSLRLALRVIELTRGIDPRVPAIVSFDQPWGEYLGRQNLDLSPLHFADALVRADLGLSGLGLEVNLGFGPRSTLPRDPLEFNRQIDRWSTLGLPLLIFLTIPSAKDGFSLQTQQAMLERHMELFLSKQTIHAIFWRQLQDAASGDFADCGLWNAFGQPKPAFAALSTYFQQQASS